MSEEESKTRGFVTQHHHHDPQQPRPPQPPAQYGTFQGIPSFPPPLPHRHQEPAIGFPQPAPPPGAFEPSAPLPSYGYQTAQGYAVADGRPVRERRLPCCGIDIGWSCKLSTYFPFSFHCYYWSLLYRNTILLS
ncbi:hypothetical protein Dimus_018740 [Dionaea muscipula]